MTPGTRFHYCHREIRWKKSSLLSVTAYHALPVADSEGRLMGLVTLMGLVVTLE